MPSPLRPSPPFPFREFPLWANPAPSAKGIKSVSMHLALTDDVEIRKPRFQGAICNPLLKTFVLADRNVSSRISLQGVIPPVRNQIDQLRTRLRLRRRSKEGRFEISLPRQTRFRYRLRSPRPRDPASFSPLESAMPQRAGALCRVLQRDTDNLGRTDAGVLTR